MRGLLRLIVSVVLIGFSLLTAGCNTVEGVGHDVSALGQGLADVAADSNPGR